MKLKRSLVVLFGILLGLGSAAALAVPIQVSITQNVQSTSGLQAATDGSFSQLAPGSIDYTINDDFKFFVPDVPILGSVTGLLGSVIDTSTGGCSASDYSGFEAGSIALFGPSMCLFSTQLNMAFAAGAIGGIAQAGLLGAGNFGLGDSVSIVGIIVTSSLATSLNEQLAVAVPEPGTLALLGIGLFGMGLARRRKKS